MKPLPSSTMATLERCWPRIVAMSVLTMMLLLALTGCKNAGPHTANVDATGVYTLVGVNGKPVPCETKHGDTPMTIKSGVFTINANGTCSSLMIFSVAGQADVQRNVKATYTQDGAELTMKWERAGTTRGKVDGNNFTMPNEGMVLSYQK